MQHAELLSKRITLSERAYHFGKPGDRPTVAQHSRSVAQSISKITDNRIDGIALNDSQKVANEINMENPLFEDVLCAVRSPTSPGEDEKEKEIKSSRRLKLEEIWQLMKEVPELRQCGTLAKSLTFLVENGHLLVGRKVGGRSLIELLFFSLK